ncbi:MAG: hypothetical protein HOQ22_09355, partial [Nocardioidaceae bacterium]|nr:hypothetical protein [Nocardioidaceae bacterium]
MTQARGPVRLLVYVAALVVVAAPFGVAQAQTESKKVFVCKYVGTPGDERLQSGNNPISVSVNAINGFNGVGSFFNDAQGRSYVIAFDTGQPAPTCPPVPPGQEPSPSPTCTETPTPTPTTSAPPEPTEAPSPGPEESTSAPPPEETSSAPPPPETSPTETATTPCTDCATASPSEPSPSVGGTGTTGSPSPRPSEPSPSVSGTEAAGSPSGGPSVENPTGSPTGGATTRQGGGIGSCQVAGVEGRRSGGASPSPAPGGSGDGGGSGGGTASGDDPGTTTPEPPRGADAGLVTAPTSTRVPGPRTRLLVPALGVSATVRPVGTRHGVLVPPRDPTVVGRWRPGPAPGSSTGRVLLTGHTVHTGGGVMDDLGKLRKGQLVKVVTRKEPMTYRTTRVVTWTKDQLAKRS